jgi:RHS repeat-associated protein
MGVVDQPPSGAPVFSWIHTDRLGTPLAVTSTPSAGAAQVIWRATYEPFGLVTPAEDPDGDLQDFTLDLRFPGQVFDAETGDHYNFFRTYDPGTGRYLEVDPIGQLGGINVFSYTKGDPINSTDPSGEDSREMWDAVRGAGVLDAYRAGTSLAREADDTASRSQLPGAHNGPRDAYRHCVWQCLITKASGSADSAAVGYAHERAGGRKKPSQPQGEAIMDLKNNAVGRACSADSRSCADSCMDKLTGGDLFSPWGRPMAPPVMSPPATSSPK